MPRSKSGMSDESDFDESDEVVDFDEDVVPDFLFYQFQNDYDEGFVDNFERELDALIQQMEEEDINDLDVSYDDEDLYAVPDDYEDER